MARRQVFYSFDFAQDVLRVAQIRNVGELEDNKPVSPEDWEQIQKKGDLAVEDWIDDNMRYADCVIVMVGERTALRRWIRYEIRKAWTLKKGLFGIYIHNLKDPKTGACTRGPNPFEQFTFKDEADNDFRIKCYNPGRLFAYQDIKTKLQSWVETAIAQRQ
jgi:hypothetical protein